MPKNYILYFAMIAFYMAIMVFIAYISRKKSNTLNSFYLTDGGLGPWMTAFAYGTTYFSSVIIIGYAGKLGAVYGLAAVWIGVGNAIIGSLLSWALLAKPTKIYTDKYNTPTMPAFFESRYKDKHIKLVTAIIVAVFLIPYSASVYQGLGSLFAAVFSLQGQSVDTVFTACVLIIAVITALYVFIGGYFATALTDVVQGVIMVAGLIFFVVYVYNNDFVSGFGDAFTRLSASDKSFIVSGGRNTFTLICLIILTSFGPWGLPQIIHKFYSIKGGSKAIRRGAAVSTVFCAIIGICVYLAGATSELFGEAINYSHLISSGAFDNIIPAMMTTVLAPVLIGLMLILIFAASMSSLSSLALSGSAAVCIDIYKGYVKKEVEDKRINIITRLTSVALIAVSAVIAIFRPMGIVELMSLSWGTLAGCFIGPYVLGLYVKKINKYGAWASIIGTLVITVTFSLIGFAPNMENSLVFGLKNSPVIGVICMVYSFISTVLFSLIADKLNLKGARESAAQSLSA